jgi:hypothetical protein
VFFSRIQLVIRHITRVIKYEVNRNHIQLVTRRIKRAIKSEVKRVARERFWVTYYGANDIHPRHLVYWIVVRSDAEKQRLELDAPLLTRLRGLLERYDYPAEGRDGVHIGFESEETVKRESDGNYFLHWK